MVRVKYGIQHKINFNKVNGYKEQQNQKSYNEYLHIIFDDNHCFFRHFFKAFLAFHQTEEAFSAAIFHSYTFSPLPRITSFTVLAMFTPSIPKSTIDDTSNTSVNSFSAYSTFSYINLAVSLNYSPTFHNFTVTSANSEQSGELLEDKLRHKANTKTKTITVRFIICFYKINNRFNYIHYILIHILFNILTY